MSKDNRDMSDSDCVPKEELEALVAEWREKSKYGVGGLLCADDLEELL